MKTNTDSRFSSAVGGPTKPATTSTGSSATPIAPHRISTARLPSSAPNGSGRQRVSPSSRDSGHSAASAANDTTSTSAAAQPNSHSGIGRF
jgi:hypothetical protein